MDLRTITCGMRGAGRNFPNQHPKLPVCQIFRFEPWIENVRSTVAVPIAPKRNPLFFVPLVIKACDGPIRVLDMDTAQLGTFRFALLTFFRLAEPFDKYHSTAPCWGDKIKDHPLLEEVSGMLDTYGVPTTTAPGSTLQMCVDEAARLGMSIALVDGPLPDSDARHLRQAWHSIAWHGIA